MKFFSPLNAFLILVFLLSSHISNAQTQPSISGYSGTYTNGEPFAYSDEISDSLYIASCSLIGGEYLPDSQKRCKYFPPDGNGSFQLLFIAITETAVCLTGDGYISADSGGFCPDPIDNVGDQGDDDDGDSFDCDLGEENDLDCNDGDSDDTDTDGDGIPDSQDDEDDVCSEFNPDDADCTDAPSCSVDDFDTHESGSGDTNDIPASICVAENSCEYVKCGYSAALKNPLTWYSKFCPTGNSCIPSEYQEPDCPANQSLVEGQCTDIPNFCELDDNNDGLPDNANTFACQDDYQESEESCPEDDPSCNLTGEFQSYSCDDIPPSCPTGGDPVQCAILDQTYKTRCEGTISQSPDCDVQFNCSLGNPSLCAIAETNYLNYCSTHISDSDIDMYEEFMNPTDPQQIAIDRGDDYRGGDNVDGSIIDMPSLTLDQNKFTSSGTMQDQFNMNLSSGNYLLDMEDQYALLDVVGALVILSATFIGFRIATS